MPYYSFTCETCDTRFEVRATIAEKEAGLRPSCPVCGDRHVRQLITAPMTLPSSASEAQPAGVGRSCGCGPGRRC